MTEAPSDKPSDPPQDDTDSADGKQEQTNADHTESEEDRPQDPWAARRDLYEHLPAAVSGSLVGGNQTGVSGGNVGGDVVLGTKVEHHYRFGTTTHASGNIPPAELDQLAVEFAGYEELVHPLRERLREERVLVLHGAPFTGRRSAALMLLRSLDAVPVRALDPNTRPTALKDEFNGASHGYIVSDLVTSRESPLRDIDLWAVRDDLREKKAYLVITVDLFATLRGIDPVRWQPPSPQAVLRSHLHALVDDPRRERELLALDLSREFLDRNDHQLREAAQFARALAGHADGTITREKLAGVGSELVREQVREWFEGDGPLLRDKAFLISLSAFDEAAYALTAELSDTLYAEFQRTEDAGREPRVGIFGTSIAKRLLLARATDYRKEEHTEWGPVFQRMARFQQPRAPVEVLREVWTSHPSARPALLAWLRKLAKDGRPLVRTRAAATAAVLAQTDLPSAMALLIEGWAKSKVYRDCLVAANALAAAHAIGAPNIPQILRSWCAEEAGARLRWTAIRAYALVGARMPDEALKALAEAARTGDDEQEAQHIAESIALLLSDESAPVRSRVLQGLLEILRDGPAGRRLALSAFLLACARAESRFMLRWYTEAASAGPAEDAQRLSVLWRTALGDLSYTAEALKVLATWAREADSDPQAERELSMLLPALVCSDDDRKRLDHMLVTLRGRSGGADAPSVVANRLRGVL